MASVVAPFLCAPPIKKVSCWTKLPIPTPISVTKHHSKTFWQRSSSATSAAPTINHELETKKYDLLTITQDTERGLKTTADQRSSIEEAMVIVEGYEAGEPIELEKLDGTWRLQYTSAPDVLVLFEAANRLPFLQLSIGMMLGGADFPEISMQRSIKRRCCKEYYQVEHSKSTRGK